jgi:hypothetical protein
MGSEECSNYVTRISHHVWTLLGGRRKGGAEAPPFRTRGEKCGLSDQPHGMGDEEKL